MFKLEYAILTNEKERLKQVENISLFEKELDEIEGQIHITFNGKEIGFVDETIPYEGEYLVTWLYLLNIGIMHLNNTGYFAMLVPDSADVWLEFKLMNKKVCISEMQTTREYKGFTTTSPIERIKTFWSDNIDKMELFQEILQKTKVFIEEVYSINEILLESREMKRLINIYQMVKDDVRGNFFEE